MPRSEITDRERRLAPYVAALAILALVLAIASQMLQADAAPPEGATEAEGLEVFEANAGTTLLAAILQVCSYLALLPALLFLFRAALVRSDRMRSALRGLLIAGPILLSAGLLLGWTGINDVAGDFVAGNGSECIEAEDTEAEDDCVNDLIGENTLVPIGQGLALAGIFGLIGGFVYTSLYAMRTGLLTRFVGTFGMAIGVGTLFLGTYPMILFTIWAAIVAWRRSYPAWETGQAEPWPAPGAQRPPGPDREEPVEGKAAEIFPDAADPDDEPEPGSIADEVDRASRRAESESEGPQKRKKRG